MHEGDFCAVCDPKVHLCRFTLLCSLVKDVQLSIIFWLVCCYNLNKLCVTSLCVLCLYVCAAELPVLMFFFSVRAPVTRSLAVCQPSKTCYVIKDFCALYQVLAYASILVLGVYYMISWWPVRMEGLVLTGFLRPDSFHCQTIVRCNLSLFFFESKLQQMYGDARHNIRVWKASVTSFHPPSRLFCLTRSRPGPSTPRGAEST